MTDTPHPSQPTLPIRRIVQGRNPRTYFDPDKMAELEEGIRAVGVLEPIVVRPIPGTDRYEIIAGERRWRAAQRAGLQEVPVLIREIPDESALAMALIENIQRENLNPLEEANGIKRLIDEFGMTHESAAQAVGRSRSAVSNLLRLQNLHASVQDMLMSGRLDMGHARALLGLEGVRQLTAAQEIVQRNLSVREAEQLVKRLSTSAPAPSKRTPDQDVLRLQEELAEAIGASVQISSGRTGNGTLKINYSSLDQLDGIMRKIFLCAR